MKPGLSTQYQCVTLVLIQIIPTLIRVDPENIYTVRNSIGIFGARISWASPDGLWDLSLWGKNLGDEAEIIQIGPDVLTTQHPTGYGPPSRWGLTARRSF